MIVDDSSNARMYETISRRMHQALDFLHRSDLAKLEQGEHRVAGTYMCGIGQECQTRPPSKVKWEAHRDYFDVLFMQSGVEFMGDARTDSLKATRRYSRGNDYLLLEELGNDVVMNAGMFLGMGPQDAHWPTMSIDDPVPVRRVVVKVRVD